jgi:thiol-disulfide isomerase/thioredoxin
MNLRKIILITLSVILLLGIIFLSFKIWIILNQKNKIKVTIQQLPSVNLRRIDGIFLNIDTFKSSKELLVLNYFNPNCEHCQYMAQSFLANKDKLSDVTIVMVTVADSAATANFYGDYQLNKLPNIIVLRDTKFQFPAIFGTGVVPSFFIYKNKKLVKKIIGETKIENLLSE